MIFHELSVSLADRSYPIFIGRNILDIAAEKITAFKPSQIIVITDSNIASQAVDFAKRINAKLLITKAGEDSKSFVNLQDLCEKILAENIDRKSLLVAFGGGVVGDLTGFIASILMRGIDFIQIPTSLLAQVDSSVGGKTAINSKHGKNLIGSFHQPKLVICDLNLLKTLPVREMRAGYAEIVKYGLINNKEFFEFLDDNYQDIISGKDVLAEAIYQSCKSKAEIVARDEKENDIRALLNLGHTFAHALETDTKYNDKLIHGEAVAIGMCLAFEFSVMFNLCSKQDALSVKEHLQKVCLPTSFSDIDHKWNAKRLLEHMMHDKKNEHGNLTLVLTKGIGQAFVQKNIVDYKVYDFLLSRTNK
jgi:3-dehydroquinate synthase